MNLLRQHGLAVSIALCLAASHVEAFPGYGLIKPRKPERTSAIQRSTLRLDDLDRSFRFYVPRGLPPNAPLLIVLHGATQSSQQIRISTGYEFERLADQQGFAVIYPDGYRRHWNDCRRSASYAARKKNVNDKAFISALIDHFHSHYQIDRSRVFAAGYSNGGHMAYRLGFELPDRFAGIAAVAANLPTDHNCACEQSRVGLPVIIINGTADPINPYNGGSVSLFGLRSRGTVVSSHQSARYFAQLNQQRSTPQISLRRDPRKPQLFVERVDWHETGKAEVVLISIGGGGHVIPQPNYRAPRLLGRTSRLINAPEEIWGFFSRQQSNAFVAGP